MSSPNLPQLETLNSLENRHSRGTRVELDEYGHQEG